MSSRVINDNIESTLNDKQKSFCIEYLKDLNGLQAYKRAYGAELDENTCAVNASKLLINTNIKKYLNDLLDEYKDNVDIEVAEIVNGLKDIVLDENTRKSDKIKAYELLGRWKQMFVDKKEITVNNNKTNMTEEQINKQLKELGYEE
jgi:phage terminase small subunit